MPGTLAGKAQLARASIYDGDPDRGGLLQTVETLLLDNEQSEVSLNVVLGESGSAVLTARAELPESTDADPSNNEARVEINTNPNSTCAGDCDEDRAVTIGELVQAVNIALDLASSETCLAVDRNGDSRATIDELTGAVNAALGGCP